MDEDFWSRRRRALWKEVVDGIECSVCRAKAGEFCVSRGGIRGNSVENTHIARTRAYTSTPEFETRQEDALLRNLAKIAKELVSYSYLPLMGKVLLEAQPYYLKAHPLHPSDREPQSGAVLDWLIKNYGEKTL